MLGRMAPSPRPWSRVCALGADLLHTGTITLSQLDAFVVSRVKELTSGLQHPVMTRPLTVRDFPIELVR